MLKVENGGRASGDSIRPSAAAASAAPCSILPILHGARRGNPGRIKVPKDPTGRGTSATGHKYPQICALDALASFARSLFPFKLISQEFHGDTIPHHRLATYIR
jgi:hypothetical protein